MNFELCLQTENSAFPLIRSYDLLSLLEQEKRVDEANKMYEKLLRHKVTIDNPWQDVEGASELENKLYKHDVDCIISGKPLNEHNLRTNFFEYYDSTRYSTGLITCVLAFCKVTSSDFDF